MTDRLRLLAVVVFVALAGCTVTISDRTPSEPESTPADVTVPTASNGTTFVPDSERVTVEIVRVVDGDTLDVRFPDGSEDTVRLVGVDTPEIHVENDPAEFEGVPDSEAGVTCLREAGHDASAYVQQRVAAGNVTLVFDPNTDRRGGYGRLLAYVYVGDRNLNHALVATGNARVYDTDFVLREAFDTAEGRARNDQRGVWACQRAG